MKFTPGDTVRGWRAQEAGLAVSYEIAPAVLCPRDVYFMPASQLLASLRDDRGRIVASKTPESDDLGREPIVPPRGAAVAKRTARGEPGTPQRAAWIMLGNADPRFSPETLVRIPYTGSYLGVWTQFPVLRSLAAHVRGCSPGAFRGTLYNLVQATVDMWKEGLYPGTNDVSDWRICPAGNLVCYRYPEKLLTLAEGVPPGMHGGYNYPRAVLEEMLPRDLIKESLGELLRGLIAGRTTRENAVEMADLRKLVYRFMSYDSDPQKIYLREFPEKLLVVFNV